MNICRSKVAAVLVSLLGFTLQAQAQLYVGDAGGGEAFVNEYTLSGQVNADPLARVQAGDLEGIAISGNNLYTADRYSGTVGRYNLSTGQAINSDYISLPFSGSYGIAATSNMLFVSNGGTLYAFNLSGSAPVAAWNTYDGFSGGVALSGNNVYAISNEDSVVQLNASTGAVENANLISNLYDTFGIAVSGNNIFTSSYGGGTISEFSTSGQTVNANLVEGVPDGANGLAVANNDIYVADIYQVQVYDAANGQFVQTINTGLEQANSVAIATPEPRSALLGVIALVLLVALRVRRYGA